MTVSEWQERMKKLRAEYNFTRNVELFEALVTESAPIDTWEAFQRWSAPFKDRGCFRGHREASWKLDTTLDRALQKTITVETGDTVHTSFTKLNPESNEKGVLLEFQRGTHNHHSASLALEHVVDWLALMQHYGAPTRLLDWTLSPYVALYFAMQEDSEGEAALWAIDLKWLEERSDEVLRRHHEDWPDCSDFNAQRQYINRILFGDDNPYIIVSASPMQLNERMLAQQGRLLCNLRHDVGFSSVLLGMLLLPSIVERQVVSKVVLKKDQRITFLDELRRMNIHRASLFPGLDEFGRLLGVNLDISVAHQIEAHKEAVIEIVRESRLRHHRPE
jgi:FRG domain